MDNRNQLIPLDHRNASGNL